MGKSLKYAIVHDAPPRKARVSTMAERSDDFESVARRLECDPNLKEFDAKLRKIAQAKKSASKKG